MRHAPAQHRVIRIISTTMIALAALFLAMAVLSLFRGDAFYLNTEVVTSPAGGTTSHQRGLASWRGRLWFAYVRAELVEESARYEKRRRFRHIAIPRGEVPSRYEAPALAAWLGIDWRGKDRTAVDPQEGLYVYRERFFTVPYGVIVASCGGLGWWIGSKHRLVRRRRRRGLCLACGYDLRGTPQLCPECGATPKPADTDAATAA